MGKTNKSLKNDETSDRMNYINNNEKVGKGVTRYIAICSTTNEYFIASSLVQPITNIINLSSYEQTCLMRPH